MEDSKKPKVEAAYEVVPMDDIEREVIETADADPADFAVVRCPSIQPPQPAPGPQSGVQVVQVKDAEGNVIGNGMVFLVPVVLPMELPKVSTGMLGPDGRPMAAHALMGPPRAYARVIVPKQSLTEQVRQEADALVPPSRLNFNLGAPSFPLEPEPEAK